MTGNAKGLEHVSFAEERVQQGAEVGVIFHHIFLALMLDALLDPALCLCGFAAQLDPTQAAVNCCTCPIRQGARTD